MSKNGELVKCPYYCDHTDNRIVCEGLSRHDKLCISFERVADRRRFMADYCNCIKWCFGCPIHRLLDDKHEIEDN